MTSIFWMKKLGFSDPESSGTVGEHIDRALKFLLSRRDDRGLMYIQEGDWCDPMNMVGYKGRGVSGWLTVAAAYAMEEWAAILELAGHSERSIEFREGARELNRSMNEFLWDGKWFARGITDDGVVFGTEKDREGKIFLNPQSWSILSGAADDNQIESMLDSITDFLETPFGTQMLAPPFTGMREDIGRVTQKFPGSAENGSVYNHASAFFIYSLFKIGRNDQAFTALRKMIPDSKDFEARGQLPVFIPNYYRGAFKELPKTAGRSSLLFNTGSVHWFYRSLIDGLFGLRGTRNGLSVSPKLPTRWKECSAAREFRGAHFDFDFRRNQEHSGIAVNGKKIDGCVIRNIQEGEHYSVKVNLEM